MFTEVSLDIDNTLYSTDIESKAYDAVLKYIKAETSLKNITLALITEAKEKAKLRVPNTRNRLFYFKELGLSLSEIKKCNSIYWDTFLQHMTLNKGVKELITLFKAKGIKLKCITDFTLNEQLMKLEKLGIIDFFDDVITSEEKGCEKPHLAMFSSPYGLLIGDDYNKDIVGAKNANWASIYLNTALLNTAITFTKNNINLKTMYEVYEFFNAYFAAIETLVYLCKKVGERADLVQAGGGNVSVKFSFKGRRLMVIKSSGVCLGDVTFFSGHTLIHDKSIIVFGNTPSIETEMHWICEKDIVIHCHPKEIVVDSLSTKFLLPYIEPGAELAKAVKNYKSKPLITLSNHGIIFQFNNGYNNPNSIDKVGLDLLNDFISSDKKFIRCNELSDIHGGLVKISSHSDRFIAAKEKFGNKCFKTFFPDFAVFCKNIIYEDLAVYIKGETTKQIYQIDEVFGLHVSCCESLQPNIEPFHIDGDKIAKREDEKYRFSLSK